MNIDPALEAKIVHTADCRCVTCRSLPPPDEPEKVSEANFLSIVRQFLKENRWRSYHTHNSRKSDIGFPDLVAVRGHRVVWIELKTEEGVATAAQLNWIEDLKKAGQEVFLFRPSDWPEIAKVLS